MGADFSCFGGILWRNQALDYDVTYTYTYDEKGNILSVSDGANTTSYVYDGLNQLTRENNQAADKTWVYSYDAGGNILSKIEYGYTTGEVVDPAATVNYEYNDAKGWKDILTSWNGQAREYDEIGNLISDGIWTYTWEAGRRLKSMTKADGTTVTFAYDNKGLRLAKTVGDATYRYTYSGGNLVQIVDGEEYHYIRYDDKGQAITFSYGAASYYLVYNAQGDVVAIAKRDGTIVVEYTYDAWGNILTVTGEMADTLGKKNPLRYRGYVYDEETGLYYLNSRYYDPGVGRFICADRTFSPDMLGGNLFGYCSNNPITRVDNTGCSWEYHKLRQEYAQMGIPYPGTKGSYLPDENGYFATEEEATWNWAIQNKPLSAEKERGAIILYNINNQKYKLGQTFVGNKDTVAGGFIKNYTGLTAMNLLGENTMFVIGFIHTHPIPRLPDGTMGHNDYPSYSTFFNDYKLLDLPGIREVYVVPYCTCPDVPIPHIIKTTDIASWYDSHNQYGNKLEGFAG